MVFTTLIRFKPHVGQKQVSACFCQQKPNSDNMYAGPFITSSFSSSFIQGGGCETK